MMLFERVKQFLLRWLLIGVEADPAVRAAEAMEEREKQLGIRREWIKNLIERQNARRIHLQGTYARGLERAFGPHAQTDEEGSYLLSNCRVIRLAELLFGERVDHVIARIQSMIRAEENAILFSLPRNERELRELNRLVRFNVAAAEGEALAAARRAISADDAGPLLEYLRVRGTQCRISSCRS
jgi:hypothetical protein